MRVFVSRPIPARALARLQASFEVDVGPADRPATRDEILRGARDADALVSMLSDRIDGPLLAACPRVRLVANFAVGHDNVDLAAAAARGVVVTNTPGVLTEASADFAFALLLAVSRRVVAADAELRRAGSFPGWAPLYGLSADVSGATLGIVGLGRIGAAVARRARAFGMSLVHAGPRPSPAAADVGSRHLPLPELLAASDFVSLHCPLGPSTFHLIDAGALARMKPGSFLINTARGPLVDEAALAAALRRGRPAGAALDVFEREPQVFPGLLDLPNVVLAPHLASATVFTRDEMARLVCENVEAVLAGRPAPHEVKPSPGPERDAV